MTVKEKAKQIKEKLDSLLTKRNQWICFIITILLAALSILDVIFELLPMPVSIAVYILAAISLFCSCSLWIRGIKLLIAALWLPATENNEWLGQFINDYRLRTVIMSLPGLAVNLIFAVFNAVLAVTAHSAWFASLAVYYIMLGIMRFMSVMYAKSIYLDKESSTSPQRELKVYKSCGIMLSFMSIALMGAVIMILTSGAGKSYSRVLTIAIAAYTFYKLVMSIVNMSKAQKEKSLLSITLRNIGHCDALVSLLSLQTAMFAAFGPGEGDMAIILNTITGGVVCVAAFAIGLSMTIKSRRYKS